MFTCLRRTWPQFRLAGLFIGNHIRYNNQILPFPQGSTLFSNLAAMNSTSPRQFPFPTRQLLLLWVACMGLGCAGCGPKVPPLPARSLVGIWELDEAARLAERINQPDSALPGVLPELDASEAKDFGSRMTLEFRSDGSLVTRTALGQLQQQKQGNWQYLSGSFEDRQLAIRCELSQQTTEVDIEVLDGGAIRLTPPNLAGLNTKLTFRRAQ